MGAKPELRAEELNAIVREIRERVRARYAAPGVTGVALADLEPILHARDAALGKVAAIGSVNPRPPGLINNLIQAFKRAVARALDWHVRDQVEFNRAVITALDAVLEALNEGNRAIAAVSLHAAAAQESAEAGTRIASDTASHWHEWRTEWLRRLDANEAALLRMVTELEKANQQRTVMLEAGLREQIHTQGERLEQIGGQIQARLWSDLDALQKRFWSDMEGVRNQYEKLIHAELRVLRQRGVLAQSAHPPAYEAEPAVAAVPALSGVVPARVDALAFAERFRGSEDSVRERQRFYLPHFNGRASVLDVGCGRGEFLDLMREAGVRARGIDSSEECVALCRAKGLDVEAADLFTYLAALPDESLDGIFSAQVVEHLPPERIPEFVSLAAAKLEHGGILAIETPNPRCLAIFATHFFIDPTHQRPVPAELLSFYLREAGMKDVRIEPLAPAVESVPAISALPPEVVEAFFDGLDYAAIARK